MLDRTCYCGLVDEQMIGQTVNLYGWVQRQRDLGGLIFIDLRDRSGIIQLQFDESVNKEAFDIAFGVRSEFVLKAVGKVARRGGAVNEDLATGALEVLVDSVEILSRSRTTPFEILENSDVKEELRLKYRYLDLRRGDLSRSIMFRHKVTKYARDYFDNNGFLEIETPILNKSTPEGARDYLVPSRIHKGCFYALPQSPQIYKQLLMISGFDRYMQIAKCFRDEDLRADRQPEFTQIDLEMSFIDEDTIITLNEGFLAGVFKELLGVEIKTPFQRMEYKEAMERFGSDKPDTRFGFELKNVSAFAEGCGFGVFENAVKNGGSVRGINVKGYADKITRKTVDALTLFAKDYGAKGLAFARWTEDVPTCSFAKFMNPENLEGLYKALDFEKGDVILLVADEDKVVFDSLGALRCECAKRLEILDPFTYNFLWITHFPLFEYSKEEGRYMAMHHPFTAPCEEDLHMLEENPYGMRARAYDIVLNGYELGGGSIRIHTPEMQEKMFKTLGLGEEEAREKFGFLMDAFQYGAPPHGGMAYGLDRLVMLMQQKANIKEVIAFPKVQNAGEPMSGCPDTVDAKQLEELHIAVTEE